MKIIAENIDGYYSRNYWWKLLQIGKGKENYIFLREKNHEEKKFPVVSGKEREFLMPEI